MISFNSQYGEVQIVGQDIPPIRSVLPLKSGVRAMLFDRSGSMVIVEIEKATGPNGARSKPESDGMTFCVQPQVSEESYFTILGAIVEEIYESST